MATSFGSDFFPTFCNFFLHIFWQLFALFNGTFFLFLFFFFIDFWPTFVITFSKLFRGRSLLGPNFFDLKLTRLTLAAFVMMTRGLSSGALPGHRLTREVAAEVELDGKSDATLSTGHINPQDSALAGAGDLSAYWEDQSQTSTCLICAMCPANHVSVTFSSQCSEG